MGGANRMHRPRRGSMQVWPRVRAKKQTPRVKSWAASKEVKLLGFLGYKVGMTHVLIKDQNQNSPTKNLNVAKAATIIECPQIKVKGIRFYKGSDFGLRLAGEINTDKVDKELLRKLGKSKKKENVPEEYDEIRAVVYTQPKLTSVKKKKPDVLEISLGGENKEKKLEFAKQLLEKGAKIEDVFKEGQLVDIHSVNKGKGFQGTVKRFGVKIRQHKSEKTKRGIGNLGAWTPKKVQFTVPQPGKMGYHLRTEYNKLVLKVGEKPEQVNPKGGFLRYGNVKGDYIIVVGSVPGPVKRIMAITEPIRFQPKFKLQKPMISYISKESKQRR
ncbi:MAG: 50S ribosomal protein L3 [Candidatus Woesearchaeota archaeon]